MITKQFREPDRRLSRYYWIWTLTDQISSSVGSISEDILFGGERYQMNGPNPTLFAYFSPPYHSGFPLFQVQFCWSQFYKNLRIPVCIYVKWKKLPLNGKIIKIVLFPNNVVLFPVNLDSIIWHLQNISLDGRQHWLLKAGTLVKVLQNVFFIKMTKLFGAYVQRRRWWNWALVTHSGKDITNK